MLINVLSECTPRLNSTNNCCFLQYMDRQTREYRVITISIKEKNVSAECLHCLFCYPIPKWQSVNSIASSYRVTFTRLFSFQAAHLDHPYLLILCCGTAYLLLGSLHHRSTSHCCWSRTTVRCRHLPAVHLERKQSRLQLILETQLTAYDKDMRLVLDQLYL